LRIECEYRRLRAVNVSQYPVGEGGHDEEIRELKEEAEMQKRLGMRSKFDVGSALPCMLREEKS